MELDDEQRELKQKLQGAKEAADEGKEKEMQREIDEIKIERNKILHDKLGLTPDEVQQLYKDLHSENPDDVSAEG